MFPTADDQALKRVYRKVYRSLSLAGLHSLNATRLNSYDIGLARELVKDGRLEDVFITNPFLYQHCFRVVIK